MEGELVAYTSLVETWRVFLLNLVRTNLINQAIHLIASLGHDNRQTMFAHRPSIVLQQAQRYESGAGIPLSNDVQAQVFCVGEEVNVVRFFF